MKSKINIMTSSKIFLTVTATVACGALIIVSDAAEKTQKSATAAASSKQDTAATSESAQKQFDTADQAADALIQVAATSDLSGAKEILGPDSEDIINSEDPVMDKNRAVAFANKAKEKKSVEMDKSDPNRAILVVGNDSFPLPIPIVKQKGKWSFDTKVGREEILNRRVGANETERLTEIEPSNFQCSNCRSKLLLKRRSEPRRRREEAFCPHCGVNLPPRSGNYTLQYTTSRF